MAAHSSDFSRYLAAITHKYASSKPGLWANIRAKRERGSKPAKPGDKDYPDSKSWKKVTSISAKKEAGYLREQDQQCANTPGCRSWWSSGLTPAEQEELEQLAQWQMTTKVLDPEKVRRLDELHAKH